MKSIQLISGSIFAGNPIVLRVTPSHVEGDKIAFHRIVLNIEATLISESAVRGPLTIPMSVSLYDEDPQDIDVSSALRSVLDAYNYIPLPASYPIVRWRVTGCDEYMQDGVLTPDYEPQSFPVPAVPGETPDYAYCIAGSVPETQRIHMSTLPSVRFLSDMPSSPMLFPKGAKFAYTPNLATGISLYTSGSLTSPTSQEVTLSEVGLHTIGTHSVYVLDDTEQPRTTFRFINRYGVLESVSLPKAIETAVGFEVKEYASGSPETFNSIRHGIVRKSNDRETLSFMTDPLDENWLLWYLHEFFLAEYVWMADSTGSWLRCHIIPESSVKVLQSKSAEPHTLTFNVKLDINGTFR